MASAEWCRRCGAEERAGKNESKKGFESKNILSHFEILFWEKVDENASFVLKSVTDDCTAQKENN